MRLGVRARMASLVGEGFWMRRWGDEGAQEGCAETTAGGGPVSRFLTDAVREEILLGLFTEDEEKSSPSKSRDRSDLRCVGMQAAFEVVVYTRSSSTSSAPSYSVRKIG